MDLVQQSQSLIQLFPKFNVLNKQEKQRKNLLENEYIYEIMNTFFVYHLRS